MNGVEPRQLGSSTCSSRIWQNPCSKMKCKKSIYELLANKMKVDKVPVSPLLSKTSDKKNRVQRVSEKKMQLCEAASGKKKMPFWFMRA